VQNIFNKKKQQDMNEIGAMRFFSFK